jgi:hypothetical protein
MLVVLGTGTGPGSGCRLDLGQDCGLWTDESGGGCGAGMRTLRRGLV